MKQLALTMDKDKSDDKTDLTKRPPLPPLTRLDGRHALYNDGCRPLKRSFPFPPKPRENAGAVLQQLRNEGIIGQPTLLMPSLSDVFPSKYSNDTVAARKFPRCLSTLISPRESNTRSKASKASLVNHVCPLQDEPRPNAITESIENLGATGTLLLKTLDGQNTSDEQTKHNKVQRTERLGRPNTPLKKKSSRHKVKRVV